MKPIRDLLPRILGRPGLLSVPWGFLGGSVRPAQMAPVPDGWRAGPPDFVGVGVPKAGTSWWFACMIEHPKVYPHRLYDSARPFATKELHYFPHFGGGGCGPNEIALYREAFCAPPNATAGEWSTTYLTSPGALELLARAAPDAKIIISLRNPVDRMLSDVNHIVRNETHALGITGTVWVEYFRTWFAHPKAALYSLYAHSLRRLLDHYPREKILVLQYESCVRAPEKEIARTFDFLGVDPSFLPSGLGRAINVQRYVIDKPDAAARQRLVDYFSDDVRACKELLPEIDLSLWPDFVQQRSGRL